MTNETREALVVTLVLVAAIFGTPWITAGLGWYSRWAKRKIRDMEHRGLK